jgi:hypothetical protein
VSTSEELKPMLVVVTGMAFDYDCFEGEELDAGEASPSLSRWLGRAIEKGGVALTSTHVGPKSQAGLTMRYGACLCGAMRSLLPMEDDQATILVEAARAAKRALDEPTADSYLARSLQALGSTIGLLAKAPSSVAESNSPPPGLAEAIGWAAAGAVMLDPGLTERTK